jgi:uncharacterized protein
MRAVVSTLMVAVWFHAGAGNADSDKREIAFIDSVYRTAENLDTAHTTPLVPKDEVSEIRMFGFGMIRLYQKLVSSQQHNVCVFTPSCSQFGLASIGTYGVIEGTLLTSDRLQRCNPFVAQGNYAFDDATGKRFDSVTHYRFTADSATAASRHSGNLP